MNEREAQDAVGANLTVTANWAAGPLTPPRGVGRIVAFTDRPHVLIQTEDGDRFWWIADLCEPQP